MNGRPPGGDGPRTAVAAGWRDARLPDRADARRGAARHRGLVAVCLAISALLTACTGMSRQAPPLYWYSDAVPAGFPETVRAADRTGLLDARAAQSLHRAVDAANGDPVNILALSGGGAGSAFGAGALVGWTRRGTRPDFQVVTGVSAGALIAPFAFLGPAWDGQLEDAFSGGRTAHLLQRRWVVSWLGSSMYRGEPLVELVDRYVTDELLAAVAAQAATGRLLLVATTDLDKERTVIWNLGVVAARGGEEARRLFRDILVASASIPGVFPPVVIQVEESGAQFDELHVDGGTTSPLFIAPEIVNVLPDHLTALHGARIYAIVNGQLGVPAESVGRGTIAVVKRSVSAVLQSSTRLAVEMAAALARQNGMQFALTAIPTGFPYGGPIDLAPGKMKALFDYGARCAVTEELWGSPVEALRAADDESGPATGSPDRCPAPKTALAATNAATDRAGP